MNNLIFKEKLISKINSSIDNNHKDNYDKYRFGDREINNGFKEYLREKLIYRNRNYISKWESLQANINSINIFADYFSNFNWLYVNLVNIQSKELLVDLIAYRILGNKKVKLPVNNKTYWDAIELANSISDKDDIYDPHFMHFILKKHDLRKIGFEIQLYFSSIGIAIDFMLEQYAYKINNNAIVAVDKGDTVLDVGACWGDTALYFASKVGDQGKVYSFEFIPENINLFNINVALNPNLVQVIELIPNPVSNKSGDKIYFMDNGPGSRIEFEAFEGQTGFATTLTIDYFVKNNNIQKVNFIKMDIEGAEPFALEGAIDTIRKFRPKLAIAIYHSLNDFATIPKWIHDLNLGYNLYLGHYTIHAEETIIFAKVD